VEDAAPPPDEPDVPELRPPRRRLDLRSRRRRFRILRWSLGLIGLAAAFYCGLVVGQTLDEAPEPGGEQRLVRTLVPETIGPTKVVTVTVTGG
jgi:hypothetical protein